MSDIQDLMSKSDEEEVSKKDLLHRMRESKETTKTKVHNCILFFLCGTVGLACFAIIICFFTYCYYLIINETVPIQLKNFLGETVEWALVAASSIFASIGWKKLID